MNEEALRLIVEEFMAKLQALLADLPVEAATAPAVSTLTERTLLELVSHEAVICEAYKDSRGVWTFGVGMTNATGHKVNRYIDKPQPLARVFELFKWVIETKYLPGVLDAFRGTDLTENQLAAALSFHYNTGAIRRASWVKSFKAGNIEKAKLQFMQWSNPPEIVERREKERDLFFDARWSNDGKVTLYEINKPSHTPKWSSARRIDVREFI